MIGTQMKTLPSAGGTMAPKAEARAVWSLGDYDRFATELIWEVGPVVVDASGVGAGQRLLDVAAGTGNVAVRAAQRGAHVVAVDITPEHFEAGRRHAFEVGVHVQWLQGDAQALPLEGDSFDVVTSCFGAMFAPDHQRVADELLRVCRPGGLIVMANFAPDGLAGDFFELFGRYAPATPSGALSPTLWGKEAHVRALFGERVNALKMSRRQYVERAESPEAYCSFFRETFGPAIAIRRGLEGQPERAEAFDRDFLTFAERSNRGSPGAAEFLYDYMLVVARKHGNG